MNIFYSVFWELKYKQQKSFLRSKDDFIIFYHNIFPFNHYKEIIQEKVKYGEKARWLGRFRQRNKQEIRKERVMYKLIFGKKSDHIGIVIDTDEIGLGISFSKRSNGWILDIAIAVLHIYITG